ncbi:hypothetical protein BCR32DRAFT_287897 [Anaeromyces robustus]|uniref:Uncharacterized protein n=1 Tax=Anaeromyces robustus TaxID=1754192 RepID=A0A1Y1VPQ8_9FUNG|nr:hypothetical protein BCR32DRAFT_287897 [Anaeromyces robustus]|eukprot:ORX63267.1 hypothetical protein BCR32DRAFT_287897 [Anaeromyces robustus]
MERKHGLILTEIKEIEHTDLNFKMKSNNKVQIDLTPFQGKGNLSNWREETLPPQAISHHNLLKEFNIPIILTQPLNEYKMKVGTQKEIQENEENIMKMLPKELMKFKDVFKIPRGLPPSRKEWDFKLKITQEDLNSLPLAKPKNIGKRS